MIAKNALILREIFLRTATVEMDFFDVGKADCDICILNVENVKIVRIIVLNV